MFMYMFMYAFHINISQQYFYLPKILKTHFNTVLKPTGAYIL